jgi:hypothetical protein
MCQRKQQRRWPASAATPLATPRHTTPPCRTMSDETAHCSRDCAATTATPSYPSSHCHTVVSGPLGLLTASTHHLLHHHRSGTPQGHPCCLASTSTSTSTRPGSTTSCLLRPLWLPAAPAAPAVPCYSLQLQEQPYQPQARPGRPVQPPMPPGPSSTASPAATLVLLPYTTAAASLQQLQPPTASCRPQQRPQQPPPWPSCPSP